jgi:hypothetical protein
MAGLDKNGGVFAICHMGWGLSKAKHAPPVGIRALPPLTGLGCVGSMPEIAVAG